MERERERMLVLTNSKIFYSPQYYIDSLALYMLEWMRKEKHRIRTLKTQKLSGSTLLPYIHGRIP